MPLAPHSVKIALPANAAGAWVMFAAALPGAGQEWWIKITITDDVRGHIAREAFFGPCRQGIRRCLLHVPRAASHFTMTVVGAGAPAISARVVPRAEAALRILAGFWHLVPHALCGSRFGRMTRLRAILGQAPMRAGEAPPITVWHDMVGTLPPPAPMLDAPAMQVLVWPGEGQEKTLAALALQTLLPAGGVRLARSADFPGDFAGWTVMLAAGEIPVPEALAHMAAEMAQNPDISAVFADYTVGDAGGEVILRPPPDPAGVESGLFVQGIAAFRALLPTILPGSAREARLIMALPLRTAQMRRVPRPLCACPARQNGEALAPIVKSFLASKGIVAETGYAGQIITVCRAAPLSAPKITVIIPSAARGAHVLPCLRALIAALGSLDAEILLAVSHIDPQSRRQIRILAAAQQLPRLRVLDLAMPWFNYARVNNLAVKHAAGEVLLFLNDDVAFFDQKSIAHMLAQLLEPDVVAVGARLFYGNGDVQHAGVVLGLGGLAEHVARLKPGDDQGPGGIYAAAHAVSAVTAACLMVRCGDFIAIGGFDESFEIALNDVDLCLRLRAGGRRIILAAPARACHYEQVSLGRHYKGTRASRESLEVQELRARYGAVIENDPCYHPQASKELGREWYPAFPPGQAV